MKYSKFLYDSLYQRLAIIIKNIISKNITDKFRIKIQSLPSTKKLAMTNISTTH